MNFDAVETTKDEYAEVPTIRSSSTTTETYSGSNVTVGNVPGTGANGGTDVAGADSANGDSIYERTESTTNNDISRTSTTTIKAPGAIEKLSVSVVLDESVTQQQEQAIRGAVAAAVGLDQTRGDLLNVVRLPFDASVTEALALPVPNGMTPVPLLREAAHPRARHLPRLRARDAPPPFALEAPARAAAAVHGRPRLPASAASSSRRMCSMCLRLNRPGLLPTSMPPKSESCASLTRTHAPSLTSYRPGCAKTTGNSG